MQKPNLKRNFHEHSLIVDFVLILAYNGKESGCLCFLFKMKIISRVRLVYFLSLAGILLWLGLIFLAPYLKSRDSGLNIFAYMIFAPICHQIPARSFFLFGHPLAVCGRCLGIYFGFLGGMGLYAFRRGFSETALPRIRTFILATSPMVIDATGNFFHLWSTPHWIRLLTGFLWGLILPFYFITGVSDFFIHRDREKANRSENIP